MLPKTPSSWLRLLLLISGLVLSPLLCGSCAILAQGIPPERLPASVDFVLHMWEARARVENHTNETLYLTPITTALGKPEAIPQWLRGRDVPVRAGRQVTIMYNVEFGLDGFVVCRTPGDCRWLDASSPQKRGEAGEAICQIVAFDNLPAVPLDWLTAVRATPRLNPPAWLMLLAGGLPLICFWGWWTLSRRAPSKAS